MKILLIDDEPFALKLLSHQFSILGYDEVTICESGHTAISMLSNGIDIFDLICCDLQMPEMDGVELVRHLGQVGYSGELILISGEDVRILQTAEILAKAQQLRVLGVLQKPVASELLQQLLQVQISHVVASSPTKQKSYPADELLWAISDGQLVNYYQPKVDVTTGTVTGVEVLVRWQHPEDGLLLPAQFIRTAEEYELIDDLTKTVLASALQQVRIWHKAGLPLQVAINIPIEHLNSLDFPDYVARMVEKSNLPLSTMILEVTEDRLLGNSLPSLEILARLRLKRIFLSIDDFGSSYNSLTQLRKIPFDEIKINRTFVHGAYRDVSLSAVYTASIEMARQLGMKTVAEGVETREDWDFVRSSKCDYAQGYFIAKPMPAEDISDWIADWEDRQRNLFAYAPRLLEKQL